VQRDAVKCPFAGDDEFRCEIGAAAQSATLRAHPGFDRDILSISIAAPGRVMCLQRPDLGRNIRTGGLP